MRVWPGTPYPQGATWDGEGVNFAVFSENATAAELCLFDRADDAVESARIPIHDRTDLIWHCYLPDARPGQLYGFRVRGHQPAVELGKEATFALMGQAKYADLAKKIQPLLKRDPEYLV